jgi:hypothetical protein
MLLPAHRSPLQKPLRGAGLLPVDPYLALYQQAVVLYSLRKTTPQTTHAIRIRRDNDSVEQDIGFVGKDLDEQAIKDFGGSSDCTIVKWYDQVGNNDSVQNNIALQAKIYDAVSGEVTKENGKPAGILDGVEDNIPILNVAGRSNIDAYFVNRHYLGNTIYPFGTNSIVGGTYGFVVQQNSSSTLITSNYGNPNLYKNKVLFAGTTRNNIYNFLGQTQNIVNHQGVNVSSWDTFHFGNFPSNQFRFEGTLQEIIVFADNLTTAERQILHDDINNYYAIY